MTPFPINCTLSMPSLRSTPCKSKLEDDRWQDFDAFRSQSQSALTTSKIVKGKAATGKTKGAKAVRDVKGANEKGVKALEGVEEKMKGEVKDEAKEDVGNEASDEDMSGMSEASEGRMVEEEDAMDGESDELSEQEEEEEEDGEEEEEAEVEEDEGIEEDGSDGDGDGDGDNGEEDHNPDGGDSTIRPSSPRPTTASPNRDKKPSPPTSNPPPPDSDLRTSQDHSTNSQTTS